MRRIEVRWCRRALRHASCTRSAAVACSSPNRRASLASPWHLASLCLGLALALDPDLVPDPGLDLGLCLDFGLGLGFSRARDFDYALGDCDRATANDCERQSEASGQSGVALLTQSPCAGGGGVGGCAVAARLGGCGFASNRRRQRR